MYVLCSANDLIKPQHIQQRGLANIRSELRRRAPTVSPRFIYIQQYTGPQPTPKHTYTNHSRHAKLNLTQRASVCIYARVCVCVFVSGPKKRQVSPKDMSSSLSVVSRVFQRRSAR